MEAFQRCEAHYRCKMIFTKSVDYITIHVPLMDSTKGMIGADAIAQMKPSVVVLNLARGPLVDQKAIVEALEDQSDS